MPILFHLWHTYVRKTPDIWMGLPSGVKTPRRRWFTNDPEEKWSSAKFFRTVRHEVAHVIRIRSRPWLSRYGWLVRYFISWRMRLDEEAASFAEEVITMSPHEIPEYTTYFAKVLVADYGIKMSVADVRAYLVARIFDTSPGLIHMASWLMAEAQENSKA
jgi:hypothetical protein